MMSRAGDTSIAADVSPRRRVVVDVILLLMRNGRILLRERANTGYGDGAYEPPSGELADRETIVETAIRVASAAGIAVGGENVSLAHVMHDVSGGGRLAFLLSRSRLAGPARVARRVLVSGRGPADEHARPGPGGAAQLRRRDALFHLPGVRARGHGRNQRLPRGRRVRPVER